MTPARNHLARAAALLMALGAAAGTTQAGKASKPTQPLNDTGATKCVVNNEFTKECTGTGQDGEFGRDVTKKNKDNGAKGFAYAKVCNSGELAGTGACPADPALGDGANDWACTQDKVTKLIWEVKTADGGLRDWLKIYTNYGDGRVGDTSEFVDKVNAQGLCGAKDWKLPSAEQLQGLVHYGVAYPGPMIDKHWFPHTKVGIGWPTEGGGYWAADAYAGGGVDAWVVYFAYGSVSVGMRDGANGYFEARLVRAGQ